LEASLTKSNWGYLS